MASSKVLIFDNLVVRKFQSLPKGKGELATEVVARLMDITLHRYKSPITR
jgi:hypothetical protein